MSAPKPAAAVLELKSLSVERGGAKLVDGVSWSVRRGEHWAVLGANGSGKTSLVNALAGYVTPSDGVMRVMGETYGQSDWRDLRARIGLASSSILQRVEPDETALETVMSGRHAMINWWGPATDEDRKSARRMLDEIECAGLADRAWGVLSQGERQRVLIGRALIGKPELLILDEPCAGLDPAVRENFLHFLNQLARKPDAPSLILVTHHLEEIMPAFTHALILKAGRVLARGPLSEALSSKNLSAALGARAEVLRAGERFALRVAPSGRVA